jgi:dTDP-4-dehydrorhamnose reductase
MIWLAGSKGMLGSEFKKLLTDSSVSFLASDSEVDITDKNKINMFLTDRKISYIINCVAYTNVDKAESEKEKAYLLNKHAVANLVEVAKERDACLIHFSTDYVFDGNKLEPYTENDTPNPVSIYGKSKLEGEREILKGEIPFFIFRISWLYGLYGNCFPKKIINLCSTKNKLDIVSDQQGSPTYARYLSENILKIIENKSKNFGIYHYSDLRFTTWYNIALNTVDIAYKFNLIKTKTQVNPVSTKQFKTTAKRPLNSKLNKDKFLKTFNLKLNNWQDNLEKFIGELKNERN